MRGKSREGDQTEWRHTQGPGRKERGGQPGGISTGVGCPVKEVHRDSPSAGLLQLCTPAPPGPKTCHVPLPARDCRDTTPGGGTHPACGPPHAALLPGSHPQQAAGRGACQREGDSADAPCALQPEWPSPTVSGWVWLGSLSACW